MIPITFQLLCLFLTYRHRIYRAQLVRTYAIPTALCHLLLILQFYKLSVSLSLCSRFWLCEFSSYRFARSHYARYIIWQPWIFDHFLTYDNILTILNLLLLTLHLPSFTWPCFSLNSVHFVFRLRKKGNVKEGKDSDCPKLP